MSRFYLKIEENNIEVYSVSDEYLQKCKNAGIVSPYKEGIDQYVGASDNLVLLMDIARCIFCSERISAPETIQTDGKWIWSSDLNHYAEHHNFQWPDEFISRMVEVDFTYKKLSDDLLRQLGDDIFISSKEDEDEDENSSKFNLNRNLKKRYEMTYFNL